MWFWEKTWVSVKELDAGLQDVTATDFLENFQWSVSKNWHAPGAKPRLAILFRNWSSRRRTASLLEKTTSQPFRGTSGKWHHTQLKLLGNFWRTRCSDIDYNALFNTHTYPFLSVLKKRKDSWSGFQFIHLPGINGFPFFSPWGLANVTFQAVTFCNEARDGDKLGAFTPGTLCSCILELWSAAQELQDLSFKASLDMPSC